MCSSTPGLPGALCLAAGLSPYPAGAAEGPADLGAPPRCTGQSPEYSFFGVPNFVFQGPEGPVVPSCEQRATESQNPGFSAPSTPRRPPQNIMHLPVNPELHNGGFSAPNTPRRPPPNMMHLPPFAMQGPMNSELLNRSCSAPSTPRVHPPPAVQAPVHLEPQNPSCSAPNMPRMPPPAAMQSLPHPAYGSVPNRVAPSLYAPPASLFAAVDCSGSVGHRSPQVMTPSHSIRGCAGTDPMATCRSTSPAARHRSPLNMDSCSGNAWGYAMGNAMMNASAPIPCASPRATPRNPLNVDSTNSLASIQSPSQTASLRSIESTAKHATASMHPASPTTSLRSPLKMEADSRNAMISIRSISPVAANRGPVNVDSFPRSLSPSSPRFQATCPTIDCSGGRVTPSSPQHWVNGHVTSPNPRLESSGSTRAACRSARVMPVKTQCVRPLVVNRVHSSCSPLRASPGVHSTTPVPICRTTARPQLRQPVTSPRGVGISKDAKPTQELEDTLIMSEEQKQQLRRIMSGVPLTSKPAVSLQKDIENSDDADAHRPTIRVVRGRQPAATAGETQANASAPPPITFSPRGGCRQSGRPRSLSSNLRVHWKPNEQEQYLVDTCDKTSDTGSEEWEDDTAQKRNVRVHMVAGEAPVIAYAAPVSPAVPVHPTQASHNRIAKITLEREPASTNNGVDLSALGAAFSGPVRKATGAPMFQTDTRETDEETLEQHETLRAPQAKRWRRPTGFGAPQAQGISLSQPSYHPQHAAVWDAPQQDAQHLHQQELLTRSPQAAHQQQRQQQQQHQQQQQQQLQSKPINMRHYLVALPPASYASNNDVCWRTLGTDELVQAGFEPGKVFADVTGGQWEPTGSQVTTEASTSMLRHHQQPTLEHQKQHRHQQVQQGQEHQRQQEQQLQLQLRLQQQQLQQQQQQRQQQQQQQQQQQWQQGYQVDQGDQGDQGDHGDQRDQREQEQHEAAVTPFLHAVMAEVDGNPIQGTVTRFAETSSSPPKGLLHNDTSQCSSAATLVLYDAEDVLDLARTKCPGSLGDAKSAPGDVKRGFNTDLALKQAGSAPPHEEIKERKLGRPPVLCVDIGGLEHSASTTITANAVTSASTHPRASQDIPWPRFPPQAVHSTSLMAEGVSWNNLWAPPASFSHAGVVDHLGAPAPTSASTTPGEGPWWWEKDTAAQTMESLDSSAKETMDTESRQAESTSSTVAALRDENADLRQALSRVEGHIGMLAEETRCLRESLRVTQQSSPAETELADEDIEAYEISRKAPILAEEVLVAAKAFVNSASGVKVSDALNPDTGAVQTNEETEENEAEAAKVLVQCAGDAARNLRHSELRAQLQQALQAEVQVIQRERESLASILQMEQEQAELQAAQSES